MPFLQKANLIIPGYALLTEAQRQRFETTAPGREFTQTIHAQLEALETQSVIQWIFSGLLTSEESRLEEIECVRRPLLRTDDYENLITEINRTVLMMAYPDFHLLDDDEKTQLSRADCSRVLFPEIPGLITSLPEQIDLLDDGKKIARIDQIMLDFERGFASDTELAALHRHITDEKKRTQAQAKRNATNKFYHRYIADPAVETAAILTEEPDQLTAFIASVMETNTPDILGLHAFNRIEAQRIADQFYEAYDNVQDYPIDHWLSSYAASLERHILSHLGTIQGEEEPFKPDLQQSTTGLLSLLYASSLSEENKDAFFSALDKIADAHAFIQATGFATQNENSTLSWLDVYNYSRSKEYIAETKKGIYRFFHPFAPLLAEYRDISLHEQNVVRQIFRTLMPLLIVAAVIITVSAMLSSIIISESAFLFILLPTIYIGGVIATSYVLTKDNLYHGLRHGYYGGPYAIPEYQVNARMLAGFSSPDAAHQIRAFYIDEIKQCHAREGNYQQMQPGTLTDTDQTDRKNNAQRKDALLLEWFDIHSNTAVGCNRIEPLALKRIQQDGLTAYRQSTLEDQEGIHRWTADIITGIRTTFHRLHDDTEAPMNAPNRFFTPPACIAHQAKAEQLCALKETLSMTVG